MSGKVRIEQMYKVLEDEEKKMRDQVVYLNGQISYNRRMQEIFNQQLRELVVEEAVKVKTNQSKTNKPKSTKAKK